MIDKNAVIDIINLYRTHGWELRRVLLTHESRNAINPDFGSAKIQESEFDGLWFSRRSRPDREAWELRRLTGNPFALVENIPDGGSDEERDALLADVERRMLESFRKGNGSS